LLGGVQVAAAYIPAGLIVGLATPVAIGLAVAMCTGKLARGAAASKLTMLQLGKLLQFCLHAAVLSKGQPARLAFCELEH
jgi:hypothetical protein